MGQGLAFGLAMLILTVVVIIACEVWGKWAERLMTRSTRPERAPSPPTPPAVPAMTSPPSATAAVQPASSPASPLQRGESLGGGLPDAGSPVAQSVGEDAGDLRAVDPNATQCLRGGRPLGVVGSRLPRDDRHGQGDLLTP